MAGQFNRYDDDEDDVLAPKEPQVTSQDPNERKAGRALRIKRRQDALKRADQPTEETFKEEEPGPIERATTAAAEELQQLALDGAAKVTNVKVTTDEREVVRRALFSEKALALMLVKPRLNKSIESLQRLEIEAADAQTQYDAITANWDTMFEIKDPLDIEAAINEQKGKCDELLAQKDLMIDKLKGNLKKMDLAYYEDLDKQDKDIKELSERIEKQITIMQRAYEKQLFLIEQAINIEREVLVDHNNKRWEALYKQRDKEEVAHLEYKFEQLEEHKLEVEAIMWDHHAKYREAKIELETLIQELQKELEKLKATCVINTEKIGYTYQVLKKREEENVFVRSQQKRKLNKMSDVANTLRSKIRKAAEDGALEEIRADAEIVKLMQAMDDLEKKCRHFSHVNNYKFVQVWRMSAARCAALLQRMRAAEVALHAHVLAEPPPQAPLPPPKSPLAKYDVPVTDPNESQVNKIHTPTNKVAEEAKDNLVRHILQLVADNTGFLVEDRLLKLIEKYPLTSRNLCTLDSIFMALEIQAEEDIELLCKIFLNYAFCPICVGLEATSEIMDGSALGVREMAQSIQEESHHVSISIKGLRGERSSTTRARSSIHRSISASTTRSGHVAFKGHELSPDDQVMMAEADEIMQKCGDPKVSLATADSTSEAGSLAGKRGRGVTVSSQPALVSSMKSNPFLCPLGHHLEIESMQVLTALNEFMAVFVPPEKRKLYDILDDLKPPDFTTPSRKLTPQEIEQYWSQWKNLFPPEKDRFWDGLLSGLNNYLKILQVLQQIISCANPHCHFVATRLLLGKAPLVDRERIHSEVVQLRQRNAALRRLVRGALPELPPGAAAPRFTRAAPAAFTATVPDEAPLRSAKLPPI